MSIIISPSILGGSFANMQETVKLIDQSKAEYIHFDVMDGDFVPNLTFGPQFISNVRQYSKKIFDVHLMINRVGKFLDDYVKAGSDIITFHLEIEENIKEIIEGTANKLIPVGRAFKIFQDKYPQFSLLMEDDKHPNSNGSYLASCVIFSHISAESSMNLSKRYKGVDNKGVDIYYSIVEDEVLPFLQQVSDEVVF